MEIKSQAKINLSLNVVSLGKMHALDSVMARVDLHDIIDVKKSDVFEVTYDIHVDGGGSVQKAYEILQNDDGYRTKIHPIKVDVKKGISVGAGLGGSSADSAAIMRYFGVTDNEVMLKAGSDVPYMAGENCARVQGLGQKLDFFTCPTMYFAFINAGCVLTKDSFCKFDQIYNQPFCPTDNARLVEAMKRGELKDVGKCMANALTQPSCVLNPKISQAINILRDFSPLGVVMTGSGGGVIALFESKAQADVVPKQIEAKVIKTI